MARIGEIRHGELGISGEQSVAFAAFIVGDVRPNPQHAYRKERECIRGLAISKGTGRRGNGCSLREEKFKRKTNKMQRLESIKKRKTRLRWLATSANSCLPLPHTIRPLPSSTQKPHIQQGENPQHIYDTHDHYARCFLRGLLVEQHLFWLGEKMEMEKLQSKMERPWLLCLGSFGGLQSALLLRKEMGCESCNIIAF